MGIIPIVPQDAVIYCHCFAHERCLMLAQAFSPKFILLYTYVVSVAYTQFRGKVRLKFLQQIVNHSTIMAPVNALMYFFSRVPTQPFVEPKYFPELAILNENWQLIRAEAQQLMENRHIKATDQHDDMGFNSFFKRGWKRFYIKWYDEFLPSAQQLCPYTISLLKTIPSVKGAMFTLLPKRGQLKPHRDPYAGSLRYHLGLVTPNSDLCRIYVDGVPYTWKDGESVLFDETYIHAAKNDTDIDRIILFCDVERPLTNRVATAINRFFGRYIVSEAVTKNLDTDRVGFFNRAFKYYYHLKVGAARLKKSHRGVYRCLQYGGVISLFYVLFF